MVFGGGRARDRGGDVAVGVVVVDRMPCSNMLVQYFDGFITIRYIGLL